MGPKTHDWQNLNDEWAKNRTLGYFPPRMVLECAQRQLQPQETKAAFNSPKGAGLWWGWRRGGSALTTGRRNLQEKNPPATSCRGHGAWPGLGPPLHSQGPCWLPRDTLVEGDRQRPCGAASPASSSRWFSKPDGPMEHPDLGPRSSEARMGTCERQSSFLNSAHLWSSMRATGTPFLLFISTTPHLHTEGTNRGIRY